MSDLAVVRRINVEVEIDIWDRAANTKTGTLYLTQRDLLGYSFQKTIKNPNSTGSISLTPQYSETNRNLLNEVNAHDVARIYEFGQLKFIGLVQRVSGNGSIDDAGNPLRTTMIQLRGMGGYLSEAKIGIPAVFFSANEEKAIDAFQNAQSTFHAEIAERLGEGTSLPYNALVDFALETWFTLLSSISGSTRFQAFANEYFNFTAGVGTFPRPLWPKEWDLYQGNYENITLWSLLDNLMDIPFNELFFDEGPRQVTINGGLVTLSGEKTHLVLRNTPFNGSIPDGGGSPVDRFNDMPEKVVTDLVKYSLSKSADEVHTLYVTSDPIWDATSLELAFHGVSVPDNEKFGKYLYRPMNVKLNNIRIPENTEETKAADMPAINQRLMNTATTLKNWFSNNDVFYNGVLTTHVPEDGDSDVRIGEKVALDGVQGHFYCESITHEWSYGGALMTHIGVTRGWDYTRDAPMDLRGRMFERENPFR